MEIVFQCLLTNEPFTKPWIIIWWVHRSAELQIDGGTTSTRSQVSSCRLCLLALIKKRNKSFEIFSKLPHQRTGACASSLFIRLDGKIILNFFIWIYLILILINYCLMTKFVKLYLELNNLSLSKSTDSLLGPVGKRECLSFNFPDVKGVFNWWWLTAISVRQWRNWVIKRSTPVAEVHGRCRGKCLTK